MKKKMDIYLLSGISRTKVWLSTNTNIRSKLRIGNVTN